MTRIGLPLGVALVALLPLSAIADDQAVIAQPTSFKFAPAPPALPACIGRARAAAEAPVIVVTQGIPWRTAARRIS